MQGREKRERKGSEGREERVEGGGVSFLLSSPRYFACLAGASSGIESMFVHAGESSFSREYALGGLTLSLPCDNKCSYSPHRWIWLYKK